MQPPYYIYNMILLELNTRDSNVCLTLKEKQTLENPYYLFEVWQTPEEKQYFLQVDTSDYPDSYNRFSLKPISSGSPINGEFLVKNNTDFWNYNVYETETQSLDPEDATGLLETGIIRVETGRPINVTIEQTSNVITLG